MADDKPVPSMRADLEVIPAMAEGKEVIVLRDEMELAGGELVIGMDALALMSLFDGKRTVRDVQLEIMRFQDGVLITTDEIQRVVDELDEHFILDSDRYREARKAILDAFAQQPVRPASHAGQAYPDDPEELRALVDGVVSDGKAVAVDGTAVRGLAAPHIDLRVGPRVYGAAYRTIQGQSFDRVVVLGTGHRIADGFFALTGKDFETPLGRVATDKDAVEAVRQAGGKIISENEMVHRREHAIEFQTVFLQHVIEGDFEMVPILCGNFTAMLDHVDRASEIDHVDRVIEALRGVIAPSEGRTLVVAGVDFSHIGYKFGQDRTGEELAPEAEIHDRALLRALCDTDPDAFWAESKRVQDRYNVCGFSSLAVLLELLPDTTGRLLDYEMWQEEATRSAVSYAALAFTTRDEDRSPMTEDRS